MHSDRVPRQSGASAQSKSGDAATLNRSQIACVCLLPRRSEMTPYVSRHELAVVAWPCGRCGSVVAGVFSLPRRQKLAPYLGGHEVACVGALALRYWKRTRIRKLEPSTRNSLGGHIHERPEYLLMHHLETSVSTILGSQGKGSGCRMGGGTRSMTARACIFSSSGLGLPGVAQTASADSIFYTRRHLTPIAASSRSQHKERAVATGLFVRDRMSRAGLL